MNLIHKTKDLMEEIHWFFQRGKKGYCEKDLWELDTWFCTTFAQMMKEFSEKNISYPEPDIFAQYDEEKFLKWKSLTYEIATLFESARRPQHYCSPTEVQLESVNKAFTLLSENFYDLWW